MRKVCSKCNISKDQNDYHKKPNTRDGRDSRCKLCVSKYKTHYNSKSKLKNNKQIEISIINNWDTEIPLDFYNQISKMIKEGVKNANS